MTKTLATSLWLLTLFIAVYGPATVAQEDWQKWSEKKVDKPVAIESVGDKAAAKAKGWEIAKEMDKRDTGFGDYTAELTMLLKNRHGEESMRHNRIKTLEVPGDGDKSLSIFDSPADVKGTSMLTFSHKLEPDDQWIYLPALKRVKRISSRNKSGPFMGSEFAFEDLGSQELEQYDYKYLRDETLDGEAYFVMERYPLYPHSGYTRQVTWVDKAEYRVKKVNFYDRKNSLLKTLTFSDYEQYLGRYWRADKMYMENHQTAKNTLLTWTNYIFRTGLSDRDFNRNALQRAK